MPESLSDKQILEKCVRDGFCKYLSEERFCLLFPKHLPGEMPRFMDLFIPADRTYCLSPNNNNNKKLFDSFIKANKEMERLCAPLFV